MITVARYHSVDFSYKNRVISSRLISGMTNDDRNIHIVMSDEGISSRIITAYIPAIDKWESDFKTRKEHNL